MSYTKANILSLLTNYHEMLHKIQVLRYELDHPMLISQDELIETMNFAHGDDVGHRTPALSNKTMYIALNYQQTSNALLQDARNDVLQKLLPLEQEKRKLDHYISLLDQPYREVIQGLYIGRKTQQEVANDLHISTWLVRRRRNLALGTLEEMYSLVENSV